MYFLIAVLVIVGIVGKIYMDNQQVKVEQRQEKKEIKVEKLAAQALKNTFKDIKSIEFEEIELYKAVGSYRIVVNMITKNDDEVRFSFGFLKGDKKIEVYGIVNSDVQIKGVTTSVIQVTYTNQTKVEL